MNRRELARRLSDLREFPDPDPGREQYATPAELAASLVHLAALQSDLDGWVIDLGTGTGVLAVGAALRGARVAGVELDAGALAVARENAERAGVADRIDWIAGDATRAPACPGGDGNSRFTVVANPPFGAQRGAEGADRRFLETAAQLAGVSYTVHNEGSREFVESFAADGGGEVTHAFRADLPIDRQFDFHTEDTRTLAAEVFRIDWS